MDAEKRYGGDNILTRAAREIANLDEKLKKEKPDTD
jgi:hypothetical protein